MQKEISAPLELLKHLSSSLNRYAGHFAIAGGLSACFYRFKPRLTNDLDIALFIKDYDTSKATAINIIESMGFDVQLGWIAANKQRKINPIALIVGNSSKNASSCTVDFLLPTLPWAENAVMRAQNNALDFKFGKFPTITPEDLIIAKALALELEPSRFSDLDDIKQILAAENNLDLVYLVSEMERLNLKFPKLLSAFLSSTLRRLIAK